MDPGTRVDPRVERTRRLVLDAMVELVAEEGLDNATLEAVAERCGVARSTIYRHWDNKYELMHEALKGRFMPPDPEPTGDLRQDILGFLQTSARWISTPEGTMMALSILIAAQRDPEIREHHAKGTRGRRGVLVAILDRAVAAGELPDSLDTTEAATEIWSPMMLRRLLTHESIDDEYLERRVDFWLDAHRVG